MKATVRTTTKVEGLDRMLRDLSLVDPIYARPWRTAMAAVERIGRATARKRAPMEEGVLAASVTSRMDAKPVPLYVVITAGAENKGFRYPFSLEAGKGKKRADGTYSKTHYRSGPKQGRSTRGWFGGTRGAIRKTIDEMLGKAAREIESRWRT